MLFATYGAPPAPRQTNPLLIVLGVCGGCAALVVIGIIVMVAMGAKMFGGLISGATKMPFTTQAFVNALENHNYAAAAAQVDPSYQSTLTASKIQAIETQMEKKLGPIQPTAYSPGQPLTNTTAGPNGKRYLEYYYLIPLKYQKGTATAKLIFRGDIGDGKDPSKMALSGKVTDFKLQADSQ